MDHLYVCQRRQSEPVEILRRPPTAGMSAECEDLKEAFQPRAIKMASTCKMDAPQGFHGVLPLKQSHVQSYPSLIIIIKLLKLVPSDPVTTRLVQLNRITVVLSKWC